MQQLRRFCFFIFPIGYYLLLLSSTTVSVVEATDKKLLVILLDGFRWNYFDKRGLDGFASVLEQGVQAEYAVPVFPSLSYPNYYSIMTGRYAENHGIMLNFMYNPETNEKFDSTPYWWEQAEPLWVTATKAGRRVDMYLWPGCDVAITGVRPMSCMPYSLKACVSDFKDDLNSALEKFSKNESDIALIYCEQPDLFGHLFGPESIFVDSVVHKLDVIIGHLRSDIENSDMHDKVNVIIVSDHGMTPVDSWSADKVPMKDYINLDDIHKIIDRGSVVGIYPEKGKLDEVYNGLKRMPGTKVWKKEDIPDRFHYKNNVRTAPILLLADPGYFINGVADKSILSYGAVPPAVADKIVSGFHGYDAEEFPDMRGIFLAWGPDFKIGAKIPPIQNQDVYNLMMYLCDLEPLPNNGSWANVSISLKNLNN